MLRAYFGSRTGPLRPHSREAGGVSILFLDSMGCERLARV